MTRIRSRRFGIIGALFIIALPPADPVRRLQAELAQHASYRDIERRAHYPNVRKRFLPQRTKRGRKR